MEQTPGQNAHGLRAIEPADGDAKSDTPQQPTRAAVDPDPKRPDEDSVKPNPMVPPERQDPAFQEKLPEIQKNENQQADLDSQDPMNTGADPVRQPRNPIPVDRYDPQSGGGPGVPRHIPGYDVVGHSACEYTSGANRVPTMRESCTETRAGGSPDDDANTLPQKEPIDNSHCMWSDDFAPNKASGKTALDECKARCDDAGAACQCFTFADHPGVMTRCLGSSVGFAEVSRPVPSKIEDTVAYVKRGSPGGMATGLANGHQNMSVILALWAALKPAVKSSSQATVSSTRQRDGLCREVARCIEDQQALCRRPKKHMTKLAWASFL